MTLNSAIFTTTYLNGAALVFTNGGLDTRNWIFGYLESAKKWVQGKLNRAFLHYLPNVWHI